MESSENKENSPAISTVGRVAAGVGVFGASLAASAVAYFNPVNAGFFPQCPLFVLTGMRCPGCGLTRGFHALLNGDVLSALHFNALIPAYAFILGCFFVSLALIAVRGRGLSLNIFKPAALYGFLVVSLVFAVLRNIPVYPFSLLAP